jgi:hypothetical protein
MEKEKKRKGKKWGGYETAACSIARSVVMN